MRFANTFLKHFFQIYVKAYPCNFNKIFHFNVNSRDVSLKIMKMIGEQKQHNVILSKNYSQDLLYEIIPNLQI